MSIVPDERGYYGMFGGRFVAETLVNALIELEEAYSAFKKSEDMQRELSVMMERYAGRPTPVYYASGFRRRPALRCT